MQQRRLGVISAVLALLLSALSLTSAAGSPDRPIWVQRYRAALETQHRALARAAGAALHGHRAPQAVTDDFTIVGHTDLGATDTNGDVWVHGNYAYVGTWEIPCDGLGAKVIDVSDPANPTMVGRVGAFPGTSAEDIVVRHVTTASFSGDLLAVGIQRCDFEDPSLDDDLFGFALYDVSDPTNPVLLGNLGLNTGAGGVHELDIFQRGSNVYALLATPFSEWFDPSQEGDFWIADITDPASPSVVAEWGARDAGLTRSPFDGRGAFGASFAHSARASADGTRAYVSYWDLGELTFDISDVANPTPIGQTEYPDDADGDTHSMTPYGNFLLVNDEDFDPRSPAHIVYQASSGPTTGIASEAPYARPLWRQDQHDVSGQVVRPRHQGCRIEDYADIRVRGRIAVPKTFAAFLSRRPQAACRQTRQDRIAQRLGAKAVVHDFISPDTSPQAFEFRGGIRIPVAFTDHATATGMIDAGRARLEAQQPSWGFLRVFDSTSGEQVATFDDLPYVRTLNTSGFWSIHNTEVWGDHAYSAWYTNGVVALDLSPLSAGTPVDPTLVGQFVPEGGVSPTPFFPDGVPIVWGVFIRPSDGLIFVSDVLGGLWIVQPTGDAAP